MNQNSYKWCNEEMVVQEMKRLYKRNVRSMAESPISNRQVTGKKEKHQSHK